MKKYVNEHTALENILNVGFEEIGKEVKIEDNQSQLRDKEVDLILHNGTKIFGIVRETKENGDLILAINGDWDKKECIVKSTIKSINASEYPYYSLSHKRCLREQKKPRIEFRFNQDELSALVGKYASVNYDGKIIEGKIIYCVINENGPKKIVIKSSSGEEKSISDYRLRTLNITGETYTEHKGFERIMDLEEELFVLKQDKYYCELPDAPFFLIKDPESLIETYFEARVRILKGHTADLADFNYNWIQETIEQRSKYSKDFGADQDFYEDAKKARDLNKYYACRKLFVDTIFDKVNEVNWLTYCKSQKDGEIEALSYIYESGILSN